MEEEGDWAGLLSAIRRPARPICRTRCTSRSCGWRGNRRSSTTRCSTSANRPAASRKHEVQNVASALLLNNRATDAADLLREKRINLGLLSEILIERMQEYKDALGLVDADDPMIAAVMSGWNSICAAPAC